MAARGAPRASRGKPRGQMPMDKLMLFVRTDGEKNYAHSKEVLEAVISMKQALLDAHISVVPELLKPSFLRNKELRAALEKRGIRLVPALLGLGEPRLGVAQIVNALRAAIRVAQQEAVAVDRHDERSAPAAPRAADEDYVDPVDKFYHKEMSFARAQTEAAEAEEGFDEIGGGDGGTAEFQRRMSEAQKRRAASLQRHKAAPFDPANEMEAATAARTAARARPGRGQPAADPGIVAAMSRRREMRDENSAPRQDNVEDPEIAQLMERIRGSDGDEGPASVGAPPIALSRGDANSSLDDAMVAKFWGNKESTDV